MLRLHGCNFLVISRRHNLEADFFIHLTIFPSPLSAFRTPGFAHFPVSFPPPNCLICLMTIFSFHTLMDGARSPKESILLSYVVPWVLLTSSAVMYGSMGFLVSTLKLYIPRALFTSVFPSEPELAQSAPLMLTCFSYGT